MTLRRSLTAVAAVASLRAYADCMEEHGVGGWDDAAIAAGVLMAGEIESDPGYPEADAACTPELADYLG